MMLPYIMVIPVNTAVLPSMSEMAARKDYEGLGDTTALHHL
jgi:O-antigen/teichoic acid export membrane protein